MHWNAPFSDIKFNFFGVGICSPPHILLQTSYPPRRRGRLDPKIVHPKINLWVCHCYQNTQVSVRPTEIGQRLLAKIAILRSTVCSIYECIWNTSWLQSYLIIFVATLHSTVMQNCKARFWYIKPVSTLWPSIRHVHASIKSKRMNVGIMQSFHYSTSNTCINIGEIRTF